MRQDLGRRYPVGTILVLAMYARIPETNTPAERASERGSNSKVGCRKSHHTTHVLQFTEGSSRPLCAAHHGAAYQLSGSPRRCC